MCFTSALFQVICVFLERVYAHVSHPLDNLALVVSEVTVHWFNGTVAKKETVLNWLANTPWLNAKVAD